MLYYKSKNITTVADQNMTIKESSDYFQSLIISNNTDVPVEIHFVEKDEIYPENSGIIITNQTLIFESHDLPKNKIIVISSQPTKLTISWSESL